MTSDCRDRVLYVDRTLEPSEVEAFRAHMRECEACRAAIERWESIERDLHDWSRARDRAAPALPHPSNLRQGLVGRRRTKRLTILVGGGFALAASITVVLTMHLRAPAPVPPSPSELLTLVTQETGGGSVEHQDDGIVIVGASERFLASLGTDRVAVAPKGRLRVVEATKRRTRLRLEAGRAAFDVEPAPGRDFRVQMARGVEVRVTGTRFSVASADGATEVAVTRGSVEIAGSDFGVVRLESGQRLRLGAGRPVAGEVIPEALEKEVTSLLAALDAAPAVAPPESTQPPAIEDAIEEARDRPRSADPLPAWRRAVSDGRCESIERAMNAHLRGSPRDAEVWSMVGDCRRKEHQWRSAMKAYQAVIEHGSPERANRARYLAAEIALDELESPQAAIPLLERYLSSTPDIDTLAANARLRLASALTRVGRMDEARDHLRIVVERHPGTPAAREARSVLGDTH